MNGIRLGGLWSKQAQDGSWYIEGPFGQANIRIYENKYKKSEKDPAYVMYVSEKAKPQQQTRPPQQSGGLSPRNQAPQQTRQPTPVRMPTQPGNQPFVDHTQGGDQTPPGQWDPGDEPLPF